jgi:hypothetical protein
MQPIRMELRTHHGLMVFSGKKDETPLQIMGGASALIVSTHSAPGKDPPRPLLHRVLIPILLPACVRLTFLDEGCSRPWSSNPSYD